MAAEDRHSKQQWEETQWSGKLQHRSDYLTQNPAFGAEIQRIRLQRRFALDALPSRL
jgi:hypothetical protein